MSLRRLLPRERGVLTWAELWADEHQFVSVASRRVQEQYQRFRFDEIQAIGVTELPHWTLPQLGWLAVALALVTVPLVLVAWPPGKAIWTAITIWPLLLAIREVARGPRCRVLFYTAAGAQPVPAIQRTRRLPAFFNAVLPLIETAQGRLESLQMSAPAPQDHAARLEKLDRDLRPLRYTLLGLVALGAFLAAVALFWPRLSKALDGVGFLHMAAEFIVAGALWQRTSPLLRATGRGIFSTVVLMCLVLELIAAAGWAIWRFPLTGQLNRDAGWRVILGASLVWRNLVFAWGLWEMRPPDRGKGD